ncbi:death domain-containing protein 1 isoform X2 [Anolis carolinensis]|uniref:death domain-containing protein 1 isoform X2 n=2 Tax=Anolis carolinensis TaxID=28377 RepID=UPI002F2B59C2
METVEGVVDHPEGILEQICQLNLTLENTFLKSNCRDNEKIVEYISKLTPLVLDLLKAFNWQLKHTTKILQNTSKLLKKHHGEGSHYISSQEGSSLADWLLQLHKQILHAVGHFEESEKELLEMNCRKTPGVQQAKCSSENSDADEAEVKIIQLLDCVNNPFQKSTPMDDENRVQETENKVLVIDTIASTHQKTDRKELEYLALEGKGNQNTPDELVTSPTKDNENGVHSVNSSGTKASEKHDLEDFPESNGSNVTVSRQIENNSASNLQILPNQEKQTEIKDGPEESANRDHRLVEEPKKRYDMINQEDKSDEIDQRKQECSMGSEDLSKNIYHPTGDLEEEDRDWMSKEFLVGMNGPNESEVACCIMAPCSILESIVVKFVNDLSSLVVDDSEELVSNVISVKCSQADTLIISPVTVAIPFIPHYRGMYRDIMVKLTNSDFQSYYLTPVSLEGHQGNHKETFAEVKTCQLGIFSVVSCLKQETITIPRKGGPRKISMDPRISFFYPPSTFSTRVTMHLKVQPIEPSTISLLKTKHDAYHSIVSTSPLVHLQHPSSQPFNKPVTVILPCPPNQEKKMEGDVMDHMRATSASAHRVTTMHPFRAMSASPRKHRQNLNESLKLLGYKNKEEGWAVMDDISVRNTQNGLVLFELDEPLDRFMVIRLSSSVENTHLSQFIWKLEEAIYNTMVKVVLYRKREDPYQIIVLLAPSKELNLELPSLREDGYSGPPEPSQQFKMREGEQVYFRFSGNIFASADGESFGKTFKLTFHVQRKPKLVLHIKEVDEFGNYSSPHYKGTALFYRVSKEMIAKNLEQPLQLDDYQDQDLLCKLALTLPKKERMIKRPQSTKRISTDLSEALWDNLLYWLSQELSEDNASYLALSLPLHRSTLQLIKLKCPDNLSAQIYELLCFWKRNLPRSADKLQLLSRYLCKTGRNDLAEDLQFKWENKVFMRRIH